MIFTKTGKKGAPLQHKSAP